MPVSTDNEEFLRLWLDAQAAVGGFLLARTGDRALTDDLLQEVALAAMQNFARYDRQRRFISWVLGIAQHKLVDYFRRHRSHHSLFDDEAQRQVARASARLADELSDRALIMHECVGRLDGRARTLVHRFYAERQALTDIARTLRMNLSTLKVRLHRIRAVLRRCVEAQLGGEGRS